MARYWAANGANCCCRSTRCWVFELNRVTPKTSVCFVHKYGSFGKPAEHATQLLRRSPMIWLRAERTVGKPSHGPAHACPPVAAPASLSCLARLQQGPRGLRTGFGEREAGTRSGVNVTGAGPLPSSSPGRSRQGLAEGYGAPRGRRDPRPDGSAF